MRYVGSKYFSNYRVHISERYYLWQMILPRRVAEKAVSSQKLFLTSSLQNPDNAHVQSSNAPGRDGLEKQEPFTKRVHHDFSKPATEHGGLVHKMPVIEGWAWGTSERTRRKGVYTEGPGEGISSLVNEGVGRHVKKSFQASFVSTFEISSGKARHMDMKHPSGSHKLDRKKEQRIQRACVLNDITCVPHQLWYYLSKVLIFSSNLTYEDTFRFLFCYLLPKYPQRHKGLCQFPTKHFILI